MTIDWIHFTPWSALAGGLLIGLAAALLLLVNGRILGVSGIVGGLFFAKTAESQWRVAFVAGLLLSAIIYKRIGDFSTSQIDASWSVLVVAGLLVGYGTRLGSGCTSGHGICGVSRGSPRSIVATVCFMLAGVLSTYIARHLFI